MLEFWTLGTVDLRTEGRSLRSVLAHPKRVGLLAFLAAAHPARPHRRAALAALLWPDLDEAHARGALRQEFYMLRRSLGDGVVVGHGGESVAVERERLWCDVQALEEAIEAGRPERALGLYGGDFLPGLHIDSVGFEHWVDDVRARSARVAAEAARQLTKDAEGTDDLDQAVCWARRLIEVAPFDEKGWCCLMSLLDRSGDRAGAVAAYASLVASLRDNLEVEPSPETRELVQRIRGRHEPTTPAEGDRASRDDPASFHARAMPAAPLVAVLPFTNLSPAPEDAFLADAFHEEMIAQLHRIGGLNVISRTSVMGYRRPHASVQRIASELGATAVVEGSVEKIGSRFRLTIQLIDPTADVHLWVEQYDLELVLDSLLEIQREIAGRIAVALRMELSPADSARLDIRHTEHGEAYQAYLRGLYYLQRPHYSSEDLDRALHELGNAVALDPGFGLAWAKLAESHARKVFFWTDATPDRIRVAHQAAAQARSAGNLVPETRLTLAAAQLCLDRDADRALRELDAVARDLPGHPEVDRVRSMAFEIQGRFQDSIECQRQLLLVSPKDPTIHAQLSCLKWILREYPDAEAEADRARSMAPDHMWPNLFKILVALSYRGPTPETRRLADGLKGGEGWVIWARYWDRMMNDEYEAAIRCLRDWDGDWDRTKMWARPLVLYEGWARWAMGDSARAGEQIGSAIELLEVETAAHPDDPRYHSSLGTAYAAIGRADAALREGERSMALLPLSKDAFYGLGYVWDMAFIHTLLGQHDRACQRLEQLLGIPSWMSTAWLEHEFRFDPLREHPGFQTLLRRQPVAAGGLRSQSAL